VQIKRKVPLQLIHSPALQLLQAVHQLHHLRALHSCKTAPHLLPLVVVGEEAAVSSAVDVANGVAKHMLMHVVQVS
jgi:hypothetical protein